MRLVFIKMILFFADCMMLLKGYAKQHKEPRILDETLACLEELQARYEGLYPFKTMVDDLEAHPDRWEYTAVLTVLKSFLGPADIRPLRKIPFEAPANVTLRRILAILGNLELRKSVLKFW